MGFLKTEVNYRFTNLIEAGAYIGLQEGFFAKTISGDDPVMQKDIMPVFGLNTNFHLLPLILKKPVMRFDWYVAAKFGGRHVFGNYTTKGTSWNYFVGTGLAAYFTKHIGAFAEFGYDIVINPPIKPKEKPDLFWGIVIKF